MVDVTALFETSGGIVPTHRLLRHGFTSHDLTWAVRFGAFVRVRQGWYSLPDLAEPLKQAFRVGGRLGCVSAARFAGLAVTQPAKLHVAVPPNAARLRRSDDAYMRLRKQPDQGVVVHWGDERWNGTALIQSAGESVASMARCQPLERTIAAADSALRLRLMRSQEWERLRFHLPVRLGRALADTTGAAESITESIARVRLHGVGYRPQLQVRIRSVGRVDMLLGRVILEFDGWEFHRDKFEDDRQRDARAAALGYQTLRFTYRQVIHRWHEVLSAIRGAVGDPR